MEHADLRNHYLRAASNPYTSGLSKSPSQNETMSRSFAAGTTPKVREIKSTVATSSTTTNLYLQRFKKSPQELSASALHLSSAGGPLTQSTVDRRQNML